MVVTPFLSVKETLPEVYGVFTKPTFSGLVLLTHELRINAKPSMQIILNFIIASLNSIKCFSREHFITDIDRMVCKTLLF
ncbi:hypothetical protein DR79_1283 [Francisella tularensis]|nr:hypothetical protein DR79_1283 [Francisella tularensis]